MQQKHSNELITINTAKINETMEKNEYARWLCLLEAVDIVSGKMKQLGHRLQNEDMDWIKPLAFQKYINERYESMKCELEMLEENNNQIDFTCTTLPVHNSQLIRS
jgi:hypothetical protein